MRGNQYSQGQPQSFVGNAERRENPRAVEASTTNRGTVNSEAHRAVQVACDARV